MRAYGGNTNAANPALRGAWLALWRPRRARGKPCARSSDPNRQFLIRVDSRRFAGNHFRQSRVAHEYESTRMTRFGRASRADETLTINAPISIIRAHEMFTDSGRLFGFVPTWSHDNFEPDSLSVVHYARLCRTSPEFAESHKDSPSRSREPA